MLALDAVRCARDLLQDVTPLNGDCGLCCGHACCLPDEDGQGGMWLFPEEQLLYNPLPDGFSIEEKEGLLLLTCDGVCDRSTRPLSCRLFPLLPKLKDGTVRAVRDRRSFCVCPLCESGLSAFSPAFKQAVREAGKILYACDETRQFLEHLHCINDSFRRDAF